MHNQFEDDESAGEAQVGGEWRSVGLVRNALRIAGEEMGQGDHWPVIQATLQNLETDYQEYQCELAVSEELKTNLDEIIRVFENAIADAERDIEPEDAAKFGLLVAEMREVYDARFAPVDPANMPDIKELMSTRADFAPYRWAENIVAMLFEGEE